MRRKTNAEKSKQDINTNSVNKFQDETEIESKPFTKDRIGN